MKITIGRAPLLKALTHGNNVVEKHTTVPILSHTLLKAEDGQLVLSSTDLEMS
ncbi:DNA polymerase III subunit beta, partial [Alphaproteobacteria bacterium]|nr:DNA polymerase III subunit beta [Alphaproteobacteria bacterium]